MQKYFMTLLIVEDWKVNMPSWLFVLILFTNAILFLVPHWL